MSLDITFCNKICKHEECERNLLNAPHDGRVISISNFIDCEHWDEGSEEYEL